MNGARFIPLISQAVIFVYPSAMNEGAMPNEVMEILDSYMKPIQRLTAKFPNQELEFQIEFHPYIQSTSQPQRRRIIFHKQPRRDMEKDPFGDVPPPRKPSITKQSSIPTVITRPPTSKSTPKATKPTESIETTETTVVESTKTTGRKSISTKEAPAEEEKRKPVYIDDLKKILDEFANKIKSTKCSDDHPTTDQSPPQIVISSPGPVNSNRNINEVVELIRRGIQVKKHVPMPKDDDFDWMQIKIPT